MAWLEYGRATGPIHKRALNMDTDNPKPVEFDGVRTPTNDERAGGLIEEGRTRLGGSLEDWFEWFGQAAYRHEEIFEDGTEAEWDWYTSAEHAMFVWTANYDGIVRISDPEQQMRRWLIEAYANYDNA